jgi:hypothetical protein
VREKGESSPFYTQNPYFWTPLKSRPRGPVAARRMSTRVRADAVLPRPQTVKTCPRDKRGCGRMSGRCLQTSEQNGHRTIIFTVGRPFRHSWWGPYHYTPSWCRSCGRWRWSRMRALGGRALQSCYNPSSHAPFYNSLRCRGLQRPLHCRFCWSGTWSPTSRSFPVRNHRSCYHPVNRVCLLRPLGSLFL